MDLWIFLTCMSHILYGLCSLCKYLMVASGRASVYIHQAKVQTSIKVSHWCLDLNFLQILWLYYLVPDLIYNLDLGSCCWHNMCARSRGKGMQYSFSNHKQAKLIKLLNPVKIIIITFANRILFINVIVILTFIVFSNYIYEKFNGT